jgi:hypothetical protein
MKVEEALYFEADFKGHAPEQFQTIQDARHDRTLPKLRRQGAVIQINSVS